MPRKKHCTPPSQSKLLKFCTCNAQSLRNKSESFVDYIVDNKIDLIATTENQMTLSRLNALLRKLLDCPRLNRRGGGIAIIFRSEIQVTEVISGSKPTFEFAEYSITVQNSHRKLLIIYRPDQQNTETFLNEFTRYLELSFYAQSNSSLLVTLISMLTYRKISTAANSWTCWNQWVSSNMLTHLLTCTATPLTLFSPENTIH